MERSGLKGAFVVDAPLLLRDVSIERRHQQQRLAGILGE